MKRFLFILIPALFLAEINAQIINGGFEETELLEVLNDTVLYPTNWYSGSPNLDGFITTDAYAGEYAMFLNSWYQGNHTVYFLNGSNGQGTPIDQVPSALSAYYKFVDAKPNDSIVVSATLSTFIVEGDSSQVVAFGSKRFPPSDEYTQLLLPIEKLSDLQPETLRITISTSTNSDFCQSFIECNYLTIDELQLAFTSSIDELEWRNMSNVFPNPFQDNLTIEVPEDVAAVGLYNALGNFVSSMEPVSSKITTSHIPVGIYFLKIEHEDGSVMIKKVLKTE